MSTEPNGTPHERWTFETFKQMLDERDKAAQQRWEAQEKAIQAALTAQEKAVQAAFLAQEKAVQAALSAAERAVLKAEVAAERRFDSVNEFRGQLTDQAATFVTRSESLQANSAMKESQESAYAVLLTKLDGVTARVDRMEGKSTGISASWVYLSGFVVLVLAIIGAAIAVSGAG